MKWVYEPKIQLEEEREDLLEVNTESSNIIIGVSTVVPIALTEISADNYYTALLLHKSLKFFVFLCIVME
jgi:hypothetical protein